MPTFLSFLYKNGESKLFRNEADYNEAMEDGWVSEPWSKEGGLKPQKGAVQSQPEATETSKVGQPDTPDEVPAPNKPVKKAKTKVKK